MTYKIDLDGFGAATGVLLDAGVDISEVNNLAARVIEAYERATWKRAFNFTIRVPNTDEVVEARNDKHSMIWRASMLRRNMRGPTPHHLDFNPVFWRHCRDIMTGEILTLEPM